MYSIPPYSSHLRDAWRRPWATPSDWTRQGEWCGTSSWVALPSAMIRRSGLSSGHGLSQSRLYPPTGAAKRPTKGMPRRTRARAPPHWCPGARCLVVSREVRFGGVGEKRVHTLGWCLGPEGRAMITVDEGWSLPGWRGRRSWCAIVRFRRMSGNPTMGPHSFRLPRNWNHRARGPTTGHRPRRIAHPLRVDP
jgi:hypothetical protein